MRQRSFVPVLLSELALPVVTAEPVMFAARCAAFLEEAARVGDLEACRKAVEVVLWLDEQAKAEEQFVYVCQDVLRRVVQDPRLRSAFASVLNGRAFAQLKGYIEYLTSREVVSEMSGLIKSSKRAA
jgi:hypothetical protein